MLLCDATGDAEYHREDTDELCLVSRQMEACLNETSEIKIPIINDNLKCPSQSERRTVQSIIILLDALERMQSHLAAVSNDAFFTGLHFITQIYWVRSM